MKNYTYHWELKDLITQFIKALDDSVVKRYTEDEEIEKEIDVKFVYAPKSRTLHWLVNKQQHIALPAVSVWISGVTRDPTRVFNKIDGPIYQNEDTSIPLQPVPINISINVSLLTKYQNDMDQMISNFVPYFDPYIILSWKHPSVTREIRSEVEWNGNLAYKYPMDITATDSYRCAVDTAFTIKGWLFKKPSTEGIGPIYTVRTNYFGVAGLDIPCGDYDEFKDDLVGDEFVVSGIPVVTHTDPIWVNQGGGSVNVMGNMLFPENVYLSGSETMLSEYETSAIDMFSDHPRLSGDNPPFIGLPITTFSKIDDGTITVDIPQLGDSGFLDIIILNDAGYGGIIKNVSADSPQSNGLFVI